MNGSKMKGVCVWFSAAKGYGFVRSNTTGDEYFCYHTAIEMDGYRELKQGQNVEFTVAMGPKGKLQVDSVKVIK